MTRRDGATDRLKTDHRLPARLPAGFFVSGDLNDASSNDIAGGELAFLCYGCRSR
jgi:hypothetical protein